MFLWSSAQDAWSTGYYLFSGSCQKWMDIWVDWVDGTSWTACPNNMYLDSSNQWKLWENGEYYDSTSQIWRSCNGNCKNLWAYQSFCFDCPSGQNFHLKKMTWIESWDSSSIPITDAQFWGKSIWREFNYYINPNSQEIIELGTQAYPFKNIGLAFVEILNYHSHSNRTINVYLLENTDNYLLWKSNFVINMTLVVVQSYSVNTPSSPQMANIFIKSEGVSMLSSQTVFWILMDNSLRLDMILHTDLMEADEISNGN